MLPVPNLKIGGLTYNALGRIILIVPTWADESDDGDDGKGKRSGKLKLNQVARLSRGKPCRTKGKISDEMTSAVF